MKKQHLIFFIVLFLILFPFRILYSQSVQQAKATGHITAEIIPVFSASETSQLNFGRFAPGPQGGEIILTPESTISVLGTVYQGTGFHNAASFYLSGDVDASYSITLPVKGLFFEVVISPKRP